MERNNDLQEDKQLRDAVRQIVKRSNWWQRYGVDAVQFLLVFPTLFIGLYLLRWTFIPAQAVGIVLISVFHVTVGFRGSHAALHGNLSNSPRFNKVIGYIFSDVFNEFSFKAGYVTHMKYHHPYTNVIDYGDSSSFRAPFLSKYAYLFGGPFFIPFLNPLASLQILIASKLYWDIVVFLTIMSFGFCIKFLLLVTVSQLSIGSALIVLYLQRLVFSMPFLHVSVFQHIGLKYYEFSDRPTSRLYQMSHSVLNLTDCYILDRLFGAGIYSCHIEHHIFPNLSDNMLRKIRPTVKKHLLEHGLPYTEKTYMDCLAFFISRYKELLVDRPSLISLAGIQ